MTWATLIAELLKALGPRVLKWLEDWLTKTAAGLPAIPPGNTFTAADDLLAAALERVRGRPFRKLYLRALLAHVPAAVAAGVPLSKAAKAEIDAAKEKAD